MKINTALFIGLFLQISQVLTAQVSFGIPSLFNDGWHFTLSNPDNAWNPDFDSNQWQTVELPHDWSVKGQLSPTLASCTGYLPGGIGWYRKSFSIAQKNQEKHHYIYFEGVYNRSEVFINGKSLGVRPNGYISFLYDLTPYLNYDKENVIAVKVDHSQSADSRWYTGSGIYRNVYLVEANPIHIAQWGVYAYPGKTTAKQGVLNGQITLVNETNAQNDVEVLNMLLDPSGKTVSTRTTKLAVKPNQENTLSFALNVNKPAIWSLDKPNLYTLRTVVKQGGVTIDSVNTRTGFRSMRFDPNNGFFLNGENMKIKGVCLHHDAGVLGAAVPRDVWKRRLQTLKEVGCNAIRTSHNPQSPDLYALCDELGLLVMNECYDEWEFPKRKWLAGWNNGKPGFQGNYDYFEAWGETDMADFVRRDRNHISIFAWSIGNEVDYPNDPYSHPVLGGEKASGFTQAQYGGYQPDAPDAMRLGDIAKRLAAVVRKYDPSRPVTAGLAGVAMSNETAYPGALDIAGYNYTESRYHQDHSTYPDRVIYGSENRHDIEAWYAVKDNQHIMGQFLWTGIDYLGESGRWPSRGFYSGLLDFGGHIKPRGYFRQSLWSKKPMAYIGSYPTPGKGARNHATDVWSALENASRNTDYVETTPSMDAWPVWNYNPGESIRVVCYTNSAKARLLLNGKEVGKTQSYDKKTGIIYWDIPYEAGTLEVVGMNQNDEEEVRNALRSSESPAALKVISIAAEKQLKEGDVAEVVLQVVDRNGIPVMIADNEVTCHVAGSGVLLGLEASNNSDMTDYTDNVHRVFNGRIQAYIKANAKGTVFMKFTAPWLQSAQAELVVE